MPSNSGKVNFRHFFGGGYATDFGPTAEVQIEEGNRILLPFLTKAENCIFGLNGGIRKMPGTAKVNTTAFESGATIKGLYEFFRQGTGGSPVRALLIFVGTKIREGTSGSSFTELKSGLVAGAVPAFTQFDDFAILSNDSSSDVPMSYDGTTFQNLAGSPPNFAFAAVHANRVWAAGVDANPSTLYYSKLEDPEVWTELGGTTGIAISPGDGDKITGLISHRDSLFVFKGPAGSIHRITGTTPTGADAFARKTFSLLVGAAGHNSIFRVVDDVGFLGSNDGLIHSLSAVEKFGDFVESTLSSALTDGFFGQRVNTDRLNHAWAKTDPAGRTIILLPVDSSTDPNIALSMDFRFQPVRFTLWPSYTFATALALTQDPNDNDNWTIFSGGNDGFIRTSAEATRSIDGVTAIGYEIETPHLDYGLPITEKTAVGVGIGIQPKGNFDIIFGVEMDEFAAINLTIPQGGSDVLAPADQNQFTLGTSTLGGGRFVTRTAAITSSERFKSAAMQVSQTGNNEDIDLQSIVLQVKVGTETLEG